MHKNFDKGLSYIQSMKKTKKNQFFISKKATDWVTFLGIVLALFFLNVASNYVFFRLDLTEDKRYSLTPSTIELLKKIDDVLYVEVYLEGEFPAGFERLKKSIKETLDEFRVYAGENIQYSFINPSESSDKKKRNQVYKQLAEKGLQPTNLMINNNNQQEQKIIFPGALLNYGGREVPVMLLKGNQSASSEQRLNQSVEGIEYELAAAIKKLITVKKKKIALIEGQGEATDNRFHDLGKTLLESYNVERVKINEKFDLSGYDLALIVKPDTAFSEQNKFKIDQFVVKGGKAIFLIDKVKANIDSIREEGMLAMLYESNLEDLLFRFGVRINPDLIQDLNAAVLPMFVGYMGDKPQTQLVPWPYYPLLNQFSNHPIVRNIDAIYGKFISTIDTVKAPHIKKTPLVFTSKYTRLMGAPVRLHFNQARTPADPKLFNKSFLPVAYLLEGQFKSIYDGRLSPENQAKFNFKAIDKPSAVIVIADGDIALNDINKKSLEPFPLGYDRFARVQFANKDFLVNCISYLIDEEGIIAARSKEVKLRPLDKIVVQESKLNWQVLNLVAPILVIILFGVVRYFWRKRVFTKSI